MASLRATAALWSASAQVGPRFGAVVAAAILRRRQTCRLNNSFVQLPAAFGSLVPFSAGTSSSEDPQPQPPQRQQLQKEAQAPRRRRRSQRVASILRQSAAPLQPWKLDGAPDDLTAALKAAESCQQVARLLVTQRTAVSSIHVEVSQAHSFIHFTALQQRYARRRCVSNDMGTPGEPGCCCGCLGLLVGLARNKGSGPRQRQAFTYCGVPRGTLWVVTWMVPDETLMPCPPPPPLPP